MGIVLECILPPPFLSLSGFFFRWEGVEGVCWMTVRNGMPDKIFFPLTIPKNVSIAVFFLCTGSHLSCGLKIKVISLSLFYDCRPFYTRQGNNDIGIRKSQSL